MLRTFICLLVLISAAAGAVAQSRDIKFRRITLENGLSQSTIKCILKDSKGYMWFGTRNGLNRYNGYQMRIYKHDKDKNGSICSNFIYDVCEDNKRNLWIGTTKGLDLYNRQKETFKHYSINNLNPYVVDIFQDSKNNLWLATNRGLYLFNAADETFKGYLHDEKDPYSIMDSGINKIAEDNEGNIWIATPTGLDKFDPTTKVFSHYYHNPQNSRSIASGMVCTVFRDSENNIWAGMLGTGLCLYKKEDDSFIKFQHDPLNPNSLAHNDVLSLTEDHQGRLWIGTQDGGVVIFDYKRKLFKTYIEDINELTTISNNSIHSLYADDQGSVWIGTWAGGVNLFSPFSNKFAHFKNILDFESANIYDITGDSEGNIWVSVAGGGLVQFDKMKKQFKKYKNENERLFSTNFIFSITEYNKDTLALGYHKSSFAFFNKRTGRFTHFFAEPGNPNSVWGIYKPIVLKDHNGNVWIGDWGGGLNFYDKKKKHFENYQVNKADPKGLSDGVVFGLCEDRDGKIWVGTEEGLNMFDHETKQFTRYIHDEKNSSTLSHNTVISIFEDSKGNIWVGTDEGLNLLDRKSSTFKSFKVKDGLPSEVISSILEDDKGNLWLGTNRGISKFNPVAKTFKNYDEKDGLQGNEFNRNTSYKDKDGFFYFGGTNGFNVFHPDSLKDNPFIPPIQFSDLQIFNKSVDIGEYDSLLKNTISETKAITLSYKESVFAIDFAAINFSNTSKNQYAYKLEGFDENWNYVKNSHLATYTNLSPGDYTFHVKGSNNDGVWNDAGASMRISITPPFWKTIWFKSLVIFLIAGSAFTWYKLRINAIKMQKEVLEWQVKERTTELLEANTELIMRQEEIVAQAENLKVASNEINILYSEIKDSIRAAEIIQKSILPPQNFIKQHLSESFILYKPKDIVSGDFYWFDVKNDNIIIAAVDCTGHGVSGAFMSFNGHHLLNQAVYPYDKLVASDILDRLNDGVIKSLHSEGENSKIQDGMDIALCIVDKDKMKMQYAGANNPLYILRSKEIIQVRGDKFSIGLTNESNEIFCKFSNREVDLQKGDIIYIFSDGYADQIGSENGEKFMYPRFRELLVKIGNEDMEVQVKALEDSLNAWRKEQEQLDDILVIGFKV